MSRPSIVGPEVPVEPFPFELQGEVVRGFGRGSKELGIPTANLPEEAVNSICSELETGVYYGWAQVLNKEVRPMVMSLGWNPYYKNEKRSAEIHIIHNFESDFYGSELKVVVTGYIRPEKDYDSLDALVEDIRTDIEVAKNSLNRPGYEEIKHLPFFA
ncbi:riboflavin kinase [Basidiobolus ranarum]|uniref:Riboflavin kinase n=1 Tax=Basidiobolus ranarum TaxID=34480 RepID=A0ABR2X0S6_9FUNG